MRPLQNLRTVHKLKLNHCKVKKGLPLLTLRLKMISAGKHALPRPIEGAPVSPSNAKVSVLMVYM